MSRQDESTGDKRDSNSMRHFSSRSIGMSAYAPSNALRQGAGRICDCAIDPRTNRTYCVCTSATTTDIAFAPDKLDNIRSKTYTFSTPCERARNKRVQMYIGQSMA
jgi:hypothetical protein